MEVFEEKRTLSRTALASWLHELATQLERDGAVSLGAAPQAGRVAVADEVLRELELERSADGSRTKLEIEIEWAVPQAVS